MNLSILDVILILLLLPLLLVYLAQWSRQARQWSAIRSFERHRGSVVIPLIHPQPSSPFLGFLSPSYINIKDAQRILDAIRQTPQDKPIDIILHTPGGLVLATQQIVSALAAHKGKVTAFVPFMSMSGGTLVALAADEIVMDRHALLGRIDPQILGASAVSIRRAVEKKDVNEVDDTTLILADVAEKAIEQVRAILRELLESRKYTQDQIKVISDDLTTGKYTHDYPISFSHAQTLGLRVREGVPKEVYDLLKLFPARQ